MTESPVKKINFQTVDKENMPQDAAVATDIEVAKPVVEQVKPKVVEEVKVAPGIKEQEADEPLLQENPHRFVLFPIKYHEVSSTRHA